MIFAKEGSLTAWYLHLPGDHYRVILTIVVVLILDVKVTHQPVVTAEVIESGAVIGPPGNHFFGRGAHI